MGAIYLVLWLFLRIFVGGIMNKLKTYFIAIICMAALLAGCGDRRTDQMLSLIDTLMNNHADSALQMLDSLKEEKSHWTKSQRMRYDLLLLKAENKAFVPLTSDSIAKDLVSYYNIWGNANERMMAHYLLGCVYRDKGDSPRAIESYLDAINKADTTAKDCDFFTLSCVYSQMGGIFYNQLLLSNSIKAYQEASKNAFKSSKIFYGILNLEKISGAYILLNKRDTAEIYIKNAYELYHKNNLSQGALILSMKLMYLIVNDPNRLSEAKELMNRFEKESKYFDDKHELKSSKRIFYFYKGQYYEGINNLDSAEYYYRKVCFPNMSLVAKEPMYKGLLSVFSKRHQADSIAKYAQLYCEVNDSSIANKDQELTAQMAASYNYSLYQKEALQSESKANTARLILLTFIFLLVFGSYFFWKRYQSIQKQKQQEIESLKADHVRATDEYSRNLHTMRLLDESRQRDLASMQKDNMEYKNSMAELKEENCQLAIVIKNIEQKVGMSQYLENTTNFMQTAIVKRLKELENVPLSMLKEEDWLKLEEGVRRYFPNLLLDLHNAPKTTKQKIQVCLLVILKVPDSCIAKWLDIKASRVSNIKSELNSMLFGDVSARTLCNNLRQKYNIISSVN